MIEYNIVLIAFAISSNVSSPVLNPNLASISTCRASEFTCPDGSDEASCYSSTETLNQWRCADGTCIAADGKCDGTVDCPDRSDETHALCRNDVCQRNWFRCTYGACVDGSAPCNNIIECADQSDELLPRCRNDTRLSNGEFRCLDGKIIPAFDHCDGIANCPDGSDETVQACAALTCATHLFQCAYGACVDQGADCNGLKECADGSDESVELCYNRTLPANTATKVCRLPPYPAHGTYMELHHPFATPGQYLENAQLKVTCDQGYGVVGADEPYCLNGQWKYEPTLVRCVPFCRLDRDVSVNYYCLVPRNNGYRICNDSEPSGTYVKPECNAPNYGSRDLLLPMTCNSDGKWNRIVKCKPECGRVTPKGDGLVYGGTQAVRGDLPWHVAIYKKPTQSRNYYEQICGGSLVSNTIVITAAHCFADRKRASDYAVAAAKLFREWDHEDDKDAQKSEITSIERTHYYHGVRSNFQHDMAILILKTPFVYYTYVRPVCLNFERYFNQRQLNKGNFGKVAGWGYTNQNGSSSPVLKMVELPLVPVDECSDILPETFTEKITGDKICAGYNDGRAAVCKGDSGGGLVFPEHERGTTRYYLRGVVSTAPQSSYECNTDTVTTFTDIYTHRDYIQHFL